MRAALLLVCSTSLVASCATTSSTEVARVTSDEHPVYRRPPPPKTSHTPQPLEFTSDGRFAYVDGKTGKALSVDDVLFRVRAHRVVIVGEQHDQLVHHEAQRRIVELASSQGPGLAVGFEMLTWEKQPALDQLMRGEVDVAGFADLVDWKKTWGFDFGLYRGLFEASTKAGARLVALNAPRDLVRAVRKKGIDGLSDDERVLLPELDLGDTLHRRWFEGIFRQADHPLKPEELDGFYRAQVLWDEAMADRAASAIKDGARQIVVVAGAGHIALGRGIPQRVERRLDVTGAEKVLTILPMTLDAGNVDVSLAAALENYDADIIIVPRFEPEIFL